MRHQGCLVSRDLRSLSTWPPCVPGATALMCTALHHIFLLTYLLTLMAVIVVYLCPSLGKKWRVVGTSGRCPVTLHGPDRLLTQLIVCRKWVLLLPAAAQTQSQSCLTVDAINQSISQIYGALHETLSVWNSFASISTSALVWQKLGWLRSMYRTTEYPYGTRLLAAYIDVHGYTRFNDYCEKEVK